MSSESRKTKKAVVFFGKQFGEDLYLPNRTKPEYMLVQQDTELGSWMVFSLSKRGIEGRRT